MLTVSPTRPAVAGVSDTAQIAAGNRKAGFYRLDLDGLRGIAIALVAMFHVWFGRVSGGVDVFLALSGFFFGGKLLRAALNPGVIAVAGTRSHSVGSPTAARSCRGVGRLRGADHPDPAADPLGDVRRPEPGEPRLLPELGVGQHGGRLSAGRRSGQSPAAHLVDVGAGPVLHRVPGAGFRVRISVSTPTRRPAADRVRAVAQRSDGGVVRLRDHRPSGQSVDGVLQQLRAGVGVAARRARRRPGPLRPLADVAAHRGRHGRVARGAVLRCTHRRRQAVSRAVGAGPRRRGPAVHPGRRQPRER